MRDVWEVPIKRAGKEAVVTGRLTLVPGPSPSLWLAAAAAGLLSTVALWMRRTSSTAALGAGVGLIVGTAAANVVHFTDPVETLRGPLEEVVAQDQGNSPVPTIRS